MEVKIYTVKETAELLGVGKRAVYEIISQGKLRSVKIGKSLKITDEAISEYMNLTAHNQKTKREIELETEIEELTKRLHEREQFINSIRNGLIKLAI
jgi:putative molybdopterin biosynthesis protein